MEDQKKLKKIIRERKLSLRALHRKIVELFGEHAIAYLTLYRNVNGLTEIREATLFQISQALSMNPDEMARATDKRVKTSRYIYNSGAYYEMDNEPLPFLSGRLVLKPGAKTPQEQDPASQGDFVKWVYGLQGEIACHLVTEDGPQVITIHRNERHSFKSTLPHYFENMTDRKASCVLIQYPKYL